MRAALALVLALAAAPAAAQVFKCVGRDGKVAFQSTPCPDAAKEERLRVMPSGGGGPAPRGPAKEGWGEQQALDVTGNCVARQVAAARREHALAQRPPGDFPQADVAASAERMCACITRRVLALHTYGEYSARSRMLDEGYAAEALAGGECKPQGALAGPGKPR